MLGTRGARSITFPYIVFGRPRLHIAALHVELHLFNMGGVNHCRLHCRLAKSRGLMKRGKYGAVIGQKTRFFVCA
jgi:hypothetical protein